MRQPPGHRLEIRVVSPEAFEHRGHGAREVADLVVRLGRGDRAAHAPLRVDGTLGLRVEPPDARGEPAGEYEECHQRAEHQQERDAQEALERRLLEDLDRRRGFLDHDRAHDVVADEDRLRRGEDRKVAVHRAAPEGRAGDADQRSVDLLAHRAALVAHGDTRSRHDECGDRAQPAARARVVVRRLQASRKAAHARARVDHPEARAAPAHDREQSFDRLRGRVGGPQACGGVGVGGGEERHDAAALLFLGIARGGADRAFLLRAQPRLEAGDELRREPGQRQQRERDQQQARADAAGEAHRAPQNSTCTVSEPKPCGRRCASNSRVSCTSASVADPQSCTVLIPSTARPTAWRGSSSGPYGS